MFHPATISHPSAPSPTRVPDTKERPLTMSSLVLPLLGYSQFAFGGSCLRNALKEEWTLGTKSSGEAQPKERGKQETV